MTDHAPSPPDQDGIGGSGRTLADLSDYLDRGRTPADPAIDGDAECQAVLASLERMSALGAALVEQEALADEQPAWLDRVMAVVAGELRAGRDIPYPDPEAGTTLSITEGAVRELVRATGDAIPGALVGAVRLRGELDRPDAPLEVALTLSVLADRPLTRVASEVREAVAATLHERTPLQVASIDITIDDVLTPDASAQEGGDDA